jgi:hypothetical protein
VPGGLKQVRSGLKTVVPLNWLPEPPHPKVQPIAPNHSHKRPNPPYTAPRLVTPKDQEANPPHTPLGYRCSKIPSTGNTPSHVCPRSCLPVTIRSFVALPPKVQEKADISDDLFGQDHFLAFPPSLPV